MAANCPIELFNSKKLFRFYINFPGRGKPPYAGPDKMEIPLQLHTAAEVTRILLEVEVSGDLRIMKRRIRN